MDTVIKKKRGRKPKSISVPSEQELPVADVVILEKKKRGRKKKYEIENFERIFNKDNHHNFNHNIAYSDDENAQVNDIGDIKTIAFGNLDITVSKKVQQPDTSYRNQMTEIQTKNYKGNIDIDEYSDEEEQAVPIENVLSLNQEKFEKYYKDNKKYTSDFTDTVKDQSLKRLRVVTCLKNIIKEDTWPDTTDTCCWWCCNQFDNCPCTLPTKYDSLRKRFTFVGIFCSWNCTKAYNLDKNDQRKYERSGLITLLIQQLYGICEAISIKCAPPRQCLKMFGGYMDIDTFRNKASVVDSYHINLINFNYIYPEITEVTNVKIKSEKKNLRLSRV
jgi:hypothetical protein